MSQGPKLRLPKSDGDGGRTPYVVALLVQIAIIGAISSVVSVPLIYLARYEKAHPMTPEHVTYVSTPADSVPVRPSPRDTATVRPPKTPPPDVPPVAVPPSSPPVIPPATPPVSIPLGITPPAATGADTSHRATRSQGPGLSPGATDPRLLGLSPPSEYGSLRNPGISSDSIHAWVRQYWDSVARVQGTSSKRPLDWTVEHNGKKYGLDPTYVYFGKYKLPTILLSLLPITAQSNPTMGERNRQLDMMRQDIMFQAMRAENADDFNAAVKAIRARKEAEHQAELQKAANKPPPP